MKLFEPVSRNDAVVRAATYLQISEYDFLALAYWRFHRRVASREYLDRLFGAYLVDESCVPRWANDLGNEITRKGDAGILDPKDYGVRAPVPKLQDLLRMLRDVMILMVVFATFGFAWFNSMGWPGQ